MVCDFLYFDVQIGGSVGAASLLYTVSNLVLPKYIVRNYSQSIRPGESELKEHSIGLADPVEEELLQPGISCWVVAVTAHLALESALAKNSLSIERTLLAGPSPNRLALTT